MPGDVGGALRQGDEAVRRLWKEEGWMGTVRIVGVLQVPSPVGAPTSFPVSQMKCSDSLFALLQIY